MVHRGNVYSCFYITPFSRFIFVNIPVFNILRIWIGLNVWIVIVEGLTVSEQSFYQKTHTLHHFKSIQNNKYQRVNLN